MAKVQFRGTGRRKSSVARVRLVPGTGNITVNKKPLDKNTLTIPLQKKGVYRIKVVCKNDQIPDSIPRYLTYSK